MNPWLAQHFFHPAFVASGAALVAAPIIIHLINRLRFRRVRFAAMEFLLQSEQRNRRRLLFEQLLLLLLRILIVLGLVALIARLILDPTQLSIFRGAKAHHLVLLDDSGSMRNRWGETTAFQEGLKVVTKLVVEGARRPDTQTFTLLLLSDPRKPLFVQRDVNERFVNELETKLENVHCSHRRLDLAAGLDEARKLLAEEKATIQHVHLVSDFRRRDWGNQQAVGQAVRALEEAGVSVNLVRTVDEHNENLAITQLSGDLHTAAAGFPVTLRIGVTNFGERAAEDVRLSVLKDGQKLPLSVRFDKIEAGAESVTEQYVTFEAPGPHSIEVQLPADALDQDNTRYVSVNVAEVNRVLVVDGDPTGDAGQYVADALAPSPRATEFSPLLADVDYLRKQPLGDFKCIYLLNVSQLPDDALAQLEEYVSSGGGLAWFLGDAVKPAYYNEKLFQHGSGLFPVPLGPARRELPPDDATTPGPDLKFTEHPIFRIYLGEENPFVDVVRISSYLPVADNWVRDDNERKDGVSTIAFLRNKQPLMFEHQFGAGRVITCLTSAGQQWNNWAGGPGAGSFLVLNLELAKYLSRHTGTPEQRVVGEPIYVSLDPAVYTDTVEITAPAAGGERTTRLRAAPETNPQPAEDGASSFRGALTPGPSPTGRGATDPRATSNTSAAGNEAEVRLTATFRDTDDPGVYTVKLLDQNQIPREQWIAYNVPVEESDLALASPEELRRRIGEDVRVSIQEPGVFQWIQGKDAGQDVRKLLIVSLLMLLVGEQLLACRLSYHPKTAGAAAGHHPEGGP